MTERVRSWLKVPWTLSEAIVALVVAFGIYTAASIPLSLLGESVDLPVLPFLAYLAIFAPAILGVATWITGKYRAGWASLGLRADGLLLNAGFGLVGGGGAFLANVALSAVITVIARSLGYHVDQVSQVQGLSGAHVWEIAIVVVAVVGVAPVVEEILFRGIFYPALRQRFGVAWAVVINAIVFGGAHLNLLGFVPLAAVGAILALLYEWRGSLAAPIIAHALNNAIVIIIALLV